MIGHLDHSGMRTCKIAGALGVLSLLAFAVGAWHAAGRVAGLASMCAEAAQKGAERAQQIRAWEGPSKRERALWRDIGRDYIETVPEGKARLAVPCELTDLAARCGLEGVSLTEMTLEELRFTRMAVCAGGSEPWMRGEALHSQGRSTLECAQWIGSDLELEELGYRMCFSASFSALAEFLRALQNTKSMLVLQKIMIRRGLPALRVEMVMAAYRRKP